MEISLSVNRSEFDLWPFRKVTQLLPLRIFGSASQHIGNQRRDDLCVGELRKGAYHFLRNFLTIHSSNTQISHSAIRNATTVSSNPMNLRKELAPPGIYDATCAIAKSTS